MKMGILRKLAVVGVAVAGLLTVTPGPALASSARGARFYNCAGGSIPSGRYSNLVVTGQCTVDDGATISIAGSVLVTNGAALDAQSAPSTIDVGGDVTALRGSLLGLGCQPPSLVGNSGHECAVNPTGHSTINVRGNVTALGSAVVLLNGITIGGNVTALGGGSEIPWAIKNNTIGRNVILAGQKTDWIGVLFNHIGGNTALLAIVITDTDPGGNGAYVGQNTIGRNLACFGVTPKVSGGFAPGSVNVVGGRALGQCAALV